MGTTDQRRKKRQQGGATYRLIRYADDFVVMVAGTRAHAEALRRDVETVLVPMGLRLSEAKTQVVHIDKGFDFLGFRIQRGLKRSSGKRYVYTFPSKRSLMNVKRKVRALARRASTFPPHVLLLQINAVLRGWCNYFRHGVSKQTFSYLSSYTWHRVAVGFRKRHGRMSWKVFRRRYCPKGSDIQAGGIVLFNPSTVTVTRYRYRGKKIPTPWGGYSSEPTPTRQA